jgi:hypothetical protein
MTYGGSPTIGGFTTLAQVKAALGIDAKQNIYVEDAAARDLNTLHTIYPNGTVLLKGTLSNSPMNNWAWCMISTSGNGNSLRVRQVLWKDDNANDCWFRAGTNTTGMMVWTQSKISGFFNGNINQFVKGDGSLGSLPLSTVDGGTGGSYPNKNNLVWGLFNGTIENANPYWLCGFASGNPPTPGITNIEKIREMLLTTSRVATVSTNITYTPNASIEVILATSNFILGNGAYAGHTIRIAPRSDSITLTLQRYRAGSAAVLPNNKPIVLNCRFLTVLWTDDAGGYWRIGMQSTTSSSDFSP